MEGLHSCPSAENENGLHFSTTDVVFFCFVFVFRYFNQALSVWLFMIGHLLIAWLIVTIVLGKATIFIVGLNGCRVDSMKRTLLDFSLSLSKKQKTV